MVSVVVVVVAAVAVVAVKLEIKLWDDTTIHSRGEEEEANVGECHCCLGCCCYCCCRS